MWSWIGPRFTCKVTGHGLRLESAEHREEQGGDLTRVSEEGPGSEVRGRRGSRSCGLEKAGLWMVGEPADPPP